MESQTNIESQVNIEPQTNTLLSPILSDVICIKLPDKINKKKLNIGIIKLIQDLEIEAIEEKNEMLFKNKTVNDILHDLNNNVNSVYIKNIIKYSPEYKNNDVIKLMIQYYVNYYGITISDMMPIFETNDSRIILGLLLHISPVILVKLSNDKAHLSISDWVIRELKYYQNNKNIRIDEICKNVLFDAHSNIIIDYLMLNHIDLLRKYNITMKSRNLVEKITEMKGLLKI